MNDYFADKDAQENFWDRTALPLRSDGFGYKLGVRLSRARQNGGNEKSIMKNHAPHKKSLRSVSKANPLRKK